MEVELVVVGDRVPDRATEVIVAAAREALSNAAYSYLHRHVFTVLPALCGR